MLYMLAMIYLFILMEKLFAFSKNINRGANVEIAWLFPFCWVSIWSSYKVFKFYAIFSIINFQLLKIIEIWGQCGIFVLFLIFFLFYCISFIISDVNNLDFYKIVEIFWLLTLFIFFFWRGGGGRGL